MYLFTGYLRECCFSAVMEGESVQWAEKSVGVESVEKKEPTNGNVRILARRRGNKELSWQLERYASLVHVFS